MQDLKMGNQKDEKHDNAEPENEGPQKQHQKIQDKCRLIRG